MNLKKLFAAGFAALAVMTSAALTANAAELKTEHISVKQLASAGVGVAYRTQDQIKSYISSHSFSTTGDVSFTRSPDLTSPYTDAGALSSASLNDGLNALNVMRYIAGLDSVTLNSEYNEQCQAGAYVSALNGTISHYPPRPSGISDSLYETGSSACGSSNLAAGLRNFAGAVLGYMDDSDYSNISTLGHRRWCLSPAMKQTGFGQVNTSSGYRSYSVMYAFDNSSGNWSSSVIKGVAWPAQNMPVEYFGEDQAWSYTYGSAISSPSSVKVTLTRKSDGKVWTFSSDSSDFYVNNGGYGQQGCVIFRPSGVGSYKSGDVFNVKITGVGTTVDYDVNFFSVSSGSSSSSLPAVTGFKATVTNPTMANLSWNAVSNVDGYKIEEYKNGTWEHYNMVTGTSLTLYNLAPNTTYNFRISAYTFAGNKYSTPTTVTFTTPSAKPSAPTGLSSSNITSNGATLTWNNVNGATGYIIKYSANGGSTWTTKTSASNSVTLTGLTAGTAYTCIVAAKNGDVEGDFSSDCTFKTLAAKPSAPTGLSSSDITSNGATLTWNNVSGATGYVIMYSANGGSTWTTKTSASNSVTLTALTEGTTYTYRVAAKNGDVEGDFSSNYTFETKASESVPAESGNSDTESRPDGENSSELESRPDDENSSKTESKPDDETDSNTESKPDNETDSNTESKPDNEIGSVTESKSDKSDESTDDGLRSESSDNNGERSAMNWIIIAAVAALAVIAAIISTVAVKKKRKH